MYGTFQDCKARMKVALSSVSSRSEFAQLFYSVHSKWGQICRVITISGEKEKNSLSLLSLKFY